MIAKITQVIPPQNFEIIRDQIAAILAVELSNQYQLDNTNPNISRVWVERFVPFDADTELPTINVNLQKADYSNKTIIKVDGEYLFNIDIYTIASSTNTDAGDIESMLLMNRIAGMIRAILSNPVYNILGFEPGSTIRTTVQRFFIGDKSTAKDALSSVLGRLQFKVESVEDVQLGTPVSLTTINNTIFLQKDEYGYYVDENGNQYVDENGNNYITEPWKTEGYTFD